MKKKVALFIGVLVASALIVANVHIVLDKYSQHPMLSLANIEALSWLEDDEEDIYYDQIIPTLSGTVEYRHTGPGSDLQILTTKYSYQCSGKGKKECPENEEVITHTGVLCVGGPGHGGIPIWEF